MAASTVHHDQSGTTSDANDAHTRELDSTSAGNIGLDTDGKIGTLVINTGPEWHGREIAISPRDQDPPVQTRVRVQERHVSGGIRYTAVFPALRAGPYVLWRTPTERVSTIVVAPAAVTELEWWVRP